MSLLHHPTACLSRLTRQLPFALIGLWALAQAAPTAAQERSAAPKVQAIAVEDTRWRSSLDAFAAADLRQAPQPGGVVFVGSSSIRLWSDLETSFADHPVVIKRGFGGSQLLDCVKLVNRLVLPYRPRMVVVYAGENDLAEGATPQEVLERFVAFVQTVKAELPDSHIAFVSIKPSPARAGLMTSVREANELIRVYSQTEPRLDYIDVFSLMLDPLGMPRTELFSPDMLHLNAEGYTLWQRVIAARLRG